MSRTTSTPFNVGDRVKLASEKDRKQFHAMTHGIVVKYRGRHSRKNPRVRWASGWGVTSKASELRLLTTEEKSQLPEPALCAGDL